MTNMAMSHDGSPAAILRSPSFSGMPDFSQFNSNGMNGNVWHNAFGLPAQNNFSAPSFFGTQIVQQHSMMTMPHRPSFNYTGPYQFRILPTPLKSRVETQIPIRMALDPLPPGIKKLHLPTHTISKPKLLAKPTPERSPDTLELYTSLVCTSAIEGPGVKQKALDRAAKHPQRYLPPRKEDGESSPQNGGDVRICDGCITRERKRAARKKIKKPDEEKVWSQDEEHRVIVFNTQEVKDWLPMPDATRGTMYIDVPMRIACYCRHHSEKLGFNVIFTLKDYQDRVIAQAMSNPIMITDDHKTHITAPVAAAIPEAPPVSHIPANNSLPMDGNNLVHNGHNGSFHMSLSNNDLQAMQRNGQVTYQSPKSNQTTPVASTSAGLSRPASPGFGGPATKKRKASGSRVPDGLTMTRLDTTPSPSAQTTSNQISTATSPYTPNFNAFSQPDTMFGQTAHTPFATGPSTPNSNDPILFHNSNRSASMDNLPMAPLYSAPTSKHPSRAPSPNGLRNGINGVNGVPGVSQSQLVRDLTNTMFSSSVNVNQARVPPTIHKIIPNEGPTTGGIEVTVLGGGFYQGLEVCFGDNKATTTTFWGDTSLVCLLPPSAGPGLVAVKFLGLATPRGQPPLFKYVNDNEDQLIRAALAVLGQKISGQNVEAPELARRIMQVTTTLLNGSSANHTGGGHMYNHASYAHLESQLLKCLDLIDLDDSGNLTDLDLPRPTGHTMLHLACSLGYHRFIAALLARGADPNAQDHGGFTPLHMAALSDHAEIVRRLVLNGADSSIKSLSGLTPIDVASTRHVLRTLSRSKRHVRSRSSGGSLHSRTSSATSLRSTWEMTKIHTHEEPSSIDSSEESPEYTSGDFEDEDPDETNFLTMRRSSGFGRDRDRPRLRRKSTPELEELEETLAASPTTAITAAVKEQFQQLMALHFPQMQFGLPGMPMFPDYQAYLPQAPFMRRVTQMMPGMGGGRDNAADADADVPKADSRWWDLSSKMTTTTTTLPPAYDEIFPQQERDQKQASACMAAVEAEADIKCATLYDQTQASTSTSVETHTVDYVEAVRSSQTEDSGMLTIGRKNAITREQREQFLRAKDEKLKGLSNDRNLFFIWVSNFLMGVKISVKLTRPKIPLLLVMVCAMLYSYFPVLFTLAWAFVSSFVSKGVTIIQRLPQPQYRAGHAVEV